MKGMARWMRLQAPGGDGHAKKFVDFIAERGGRVVYKATRLPRSEWNFPLEIFKGAYDTSSTSQKH